MDEAERLRNQAFEMSFWGNCCNTYYEESKQFIYMRKMGFPLKASWRSPKSFDAAGRSFVDFGGGPVSVLLKFESLAHGCVVDPAPYPDWVTGRYKAAGITVSRRLGEEYRGQGFDVALIYNCLQHVSDPEKIVKNALAAAKELHMFEWINIPPHPGHPHELKAELLDKWTGQRGTTTQINEDGNVGTAWYL